MVPMKMLATWMPKLARNFSYCIQMAMQRGREAFSQTGITLHCPLQCIGHNSKYLGLPVDTECHTKSWWTRGSHPHSFYTHPSTQVKRKMKHCTRLLCTVIPNEREKFKNIEKLLLISQNFRLDLVLVNCQWLGWKDWASLKPHLTFSYFLILWGGIWGVVWSSNPWRGRKKIETPPGPDITPPVKWTKIV